MPTNDDHAEDILHPEGEARGAVGLGGGDVDQHVHGVGEEDFTGNSVSGAGDVNADGTDDLIIGSFRSDNNGTESGVAYVVFGRAGLGSTGEFELSALDGSNGFVVALDGYGRGANFGKTDLMKHR